MDRERERERETGKTLGITFKLAINWKCFRGVEKGGRLIDNPLPDAK